MQKKLITLLLSSIISVNTFAATSLTGYNSEQEIMVRGDLSTTKNNMGLIISKLPANSSTEQLFAFAGTTPIIWAKYYEGTSTGFIQSTSVHKDIQTNTVTLTTEILTPAMGQRFGNGNGVYAAFKGTNPFGEFINASDPNTYRGVSLQAFLSIVGMWSKYKTASKGFVVASMHDYQGNVNWSNCANNTITSNTNSNINFCTSKNFHNEAAVNIKPEWYVMAPAEVAEGHNIIPSYTANGCLLEGGNVKECQVRGGFSFIKASEGSDFPITSQRMWHYHESENGDTGSMVEFLIAANIIRPFSTYNGLLIDNANKKISELKITQQVMEIIQLSYQEFKQRPRGVRGHQ